MLTRQAIIEPAIATPAAFAHVDTWVFDLDNTLYSPHTTIFEQVDTKIRQFISTLLKIDDAAAHALKKDLYRRYGTSLRGLMVEYGISSDDFLDFVHDIDHSVLDPDPELADVIRRLPGRRFIMTNGTRAHATKTANRLGITEHFDDIFDIVDADLIPKPNESAYKAFFARHAIDPSRAAMFEDLSRNLVVPFGAGMKTVLVLPPGELPLFTRTWQQEGHGDPHVEFATDDLTAFLNGICA